MNEIILFMVLCGSLTVICLILNYLPNRFLTAFKDLDRDSPLDGLRGILATTVVSYHFYLNYFYQKTGRWGDVSHPLILNLGAVPVSLFFMITGFLFFNKILKADINWPQLFASRFRRILPLYYFLGVATTVIFLLEHRYHMSLAEWGKWIFSWAMFIDLHFPNFPNWNLIAGASWTLIYEWGFYFALPVLYWIIHGSIKQKIVLFLTFLVFVWICTRTSLDFYLLFVLALFASWYKEKSRYSIQKYNKLFSGLVVILIGYALFFTHGYTLLQKLLLSVAFFLLANGANVFGLLKSKGLKILGELSYSIYLMHGIMIYVLFNQVKIFDFNQGLFDYYWLFPLLLIIVISFATITYFMVERPFLKR